MSTSVVTELLDDAAEFLDGRVDDLLSFLDDVAALGDETAPTPSAELAVLLAGTPAVRLVRPVRRPIAPRPVRFRRRVAGLAAAAVAGLSVTGAAAMANELPRPMQRVVAHFSEDYLPFAFPRPVGDPPTHAVPASPGSSGRTDVGNATTGDGRLGGSETSTRPGGAIRGRSGTAGQHERHAAVHRGTGTGTGTGTGASLAPGPASGQASSGGGQHQGNGTAHVPAGGSSDNQGSAAGESSRTGSETGATPTREGHAYAGTDNAGQGTKGKLAAPPEQSGAGPVSKPDPVPPATGKDGAKSTSAGPVSSGPTAETDKAKAPTSTPPVKRTGLTQAPAVAPPERSADAPAGGSATDGAGPGAG